MDDITHQVGALYNAFPYPSVPPHLRADGFPRLLLGYVERATSNADRPLSILDAGCGTGAGLIPLAELSPDDRIVGIDLSARALEQIHTQVQHRGLGNIALHVADIMDPETLAPVRAHARGGFDVIYASGVIHHLSDPEAGLANLRAMLAPGGVLSLMVYGHHGRMPVTRIARAIEIVRPPDPPDAPPDTPSKGIDSERVAFARSLVGSLGPGSVVKPPWDDVTAISDAELVDRYLHVNARSYTVTQLFELIDAAGLRFLRWLEPRLWSVKHIFGDSSLARELDALPDIDRYRVIENLFDRRGLEVLLTHPDTRPRPALTRTSMREAVLTWNPQVSVSITERRAGAHEWSERVRVRVRNGPEAELSGIGAALTQLARAPIPARDLVEQAMQLVFVDTDVAHAALYELIEEEVLFAP